MLLCVCSLLVIVVSEKRLCYPGNQVSTDYCTIIADYSASADHHYLSDRYTRLYYTNEKLLEWRNVKWQKLNAWFVWWHIAVIDKVMVYIHNEQNDSIRSLIGMWWSLDNSWNILWVDVFSCGLLLYIICGKRRISVTISTQYYYPY